MKREKLKKNDFLSKLEFIKNNLPLILLITPILGGLCQIFELSKMSISFIRFFSPTQLIPDGLLILFIGILIYFTVQIGLLFFKKNNIQGNKNSVMSIKVSIAVIIMAVLLLFILGTIQFIEDLYTEQKLEFALFIIHIPIIIIVSGIILKSIKSLYENFKKGKLHTYILTKPKLSQIIKNVGFVLLLGIGSFLFKYLLLGTIFILSELRQAYLLPNNLSNMINIEKKIYNRDNNSSKVVYFNDKFIFIKHGKKDQNLTFEIIKFDMLFNSKYNKYLEDE